MVCNDPFIKCNLIFSNKCIRHRCNIFSLEDKYNPASVQLTRCVFDAATDINYVDFNTLYDLQVLPFMVCKGKYTIFNVFIGNRRLIFEVAIVGNLFIWEKTISTFFLNDFPIAFPVVHVRVAYKVEQTAHGRGKMKTNYKVKEKCWSHIFKPFKMS